MSTEVLRPEADIATGWTDPVSNHFAVVTDGSDATGIQTLVPGTDRFALPPLPSFAEGVAGLRARARLVCGDGIGSARLLLWDGTNLLAGPTWIGPAALTWFEWVPALAPDGGAWTVAKVNALELRCECEAVNLTGVVVSEIEVPVDVTAAVTVARHRVNLPVRRMVVAAPGARPLVAAPGGARAPVPGPGARPAVVVPKRRMVVAAGPSAD